MVTKQTKIVATISDRRSDTAFLKELYENGVNVFRLNTAHQEPEESLDVIRRMRSISDMIAILIDTKGPEVRTGASEEPLPVETGERVDILPEDIEYTGKNKQIRVSYPDFVKDVAPQSMILIDDGEIALRVEGKTSTCLECIAENGGEIGSRKSINVPGASLRLPSLTEKDKRYIQLAKEEEIDFIAHSFVRNIDDVTCIKNLLGDKNDIVKIIAKIENQEGVENVSSILTEAYGLMVARGDLAMEIPIWDVPITQKSIISECISRAQPVITATQMLYTMIHNPRPTRAEINDVANAVFDGSDAVMLSGETTVGKYPVEAVQMMSNIIKSVESKMGSFKKDRPTNWQNDVQRFLAESAYSATQNLPIKAMVTMTRWGATARLLSSYRSMVPIYTMCTKKHTKRLLALQHGIYPTYVERREEQSELLYETMSRYLHENKFDEEDLVLIIGTDTKTSFAADLLEIKTVRSLIREKRKQFDYSRLFLEGEEE